MTPARPGGQPLHPVSGAALAMPRSQIREIANQVIDRPGADVVRLELGEPDFLPPAHVVEAAAAAARAGARYSHSAGTLPLREALSERLARVSGVGCPPDRVVVSQGAMQGIAAVFAAVVEPGDRVLVPDPGFANYRAITVLSNAVPVPYRLDPAAGFQPDLDEVAALAERHRPKVIMVNSPGNPTGSVLPPDAGRALVGVASRVGALVVSDEVYDELVYEGAPANLAAYDPGRVAGVYSFSKTYAMTGWRVGYVACGAELAEVLTTVQDVAVACISAVSQAAALAALRGPQDQVAVMRDTFRGRRDMVAARLEAAGIKAVAPHGAFYQMVPLAAGVDSRRAANDLLSWGAAVAPGSAFGDVAADCLRLHFAAGDDVVAEGLRRILAWYQATEGGLVPATR